MEIFSFSSTGSAKKRRIWASRFAFVDGRMPWPVTHRKPSWRHSSSMRAAVAVASGDGDVASGSPVANGERSMTGMPMTVLLVL